MKFAKSADSFRVEELMHPILLGGNYFYYILEKHGIDSASAIKALEKQNKARIHYSGLKDANAATSQWICSLKELKETDDKRVQLTYAGNGENRIHVGMHSANRFIAKLSDLTLEEKKFLKKGLHKITLPNYFDEQRFNEKTLRLGSALRSGQFEMALKTALTEKLGMESEKSHKIKAEIKEKWGKWDELIKSETIPRSKKAIFEHLQKGANFREAIELLEKKTVAIACRAIQSLEFNTELSAQISKHKNSSQKSIRIANSTYPIEFRKRAVKRQIEISEVYPSKVKLVRKTFFELKKPIVKFSGNDCTLEFFLKKGSYGTITIKCIIALCENK